MTKSHVSMETAVCPVCGIEHETGAILFDLRLLPSMEGRTATRWAMCPEHKKLFDDGFVAMVEAAAPSASTTALKQEDARRTGRLMHMKVAVFERLFGAPPRGGMVFIEPGVIERVQEMTGP